MQLEHRANKTFLRNPGNGGYALIHNHAVTCLISKISQVIFQIQNSISVH